jgi:hypothetical protein
MTLLLLLALGIPLSWLWRPGRKTAAKEEFRRERNQAPKLACCDLALTRRLPWEQFIPLDETDDDAEGCSGHSSLSSEKHAKVWRCGYPAEGRPC